MWRARIPFVQFPSFIRCNCIEWEMNWKRSSPGGKVEIILRFRGSEWGSEAKADKEKKKQKSPNANESILCAVHEWEKSRAK